MTKAGRTAAAGESPWLRRFERAASSLVTALAVVLFLVLFCGGGTAHAADGSELNWTPLWIGAAFQVGVSLVAAALNRQASQVTAATDRRLDQVENTIVEINTRLSTTREQMALREDLARLDQKLSDRLDEVLAQNHQVLALLNAPGTRR